MKLRRVKNTARSRQRIAQPVQPPASYGYSQRAERVRGADRQVLGKVPHNGNPWWHRAGAVILGAAMLLAAVNILSLSSQARILPMRGQTQTYLRDKSIYEATASRLLAASAWNKNKVTVNTSGVAKELKSRYPEIAEASFTIPLFSHRPVIYIEADQPKLVLAAKDGAFLVASSGRALLKESSPGALKQFNLPVVTDQSGLNLQLGKTALPAQDVDFIYIVGQQLQAKQIKFESLLLPPESRELHAKVAGEGYLVKFNLMSLNPREQVGAFLAATESFKKQNVKPSQYIDVRVDGRVYYK
jgi:hypothetical protein